MCRPVTAVAVGMGRTLATLRADTATAAWMPPGPGWWPRPRCVPSAEANAEWQVTQCPHCRGHRACLRALSALDADAEVLVSGNPSPAWDDFAWPLEATFDGGARTVNGRRVAGAGVALWAHTAGAPPARLASVTIAIPWDAGAQTAEAIGCGAALHLLAALSPPHRAARIVGDNLAVIRYCAGSARLRRTTMQAHLEPNLATTLARGWRLAWQAVRRRLNQAADSLATAGTRWARTLLDQSVHEVRAHTSWECNPADYGITFLA